MTKRIFAISLFSFLFCFGAQSQSQYKPRIVKKWDEKPNTSILPDFSYAGFGYGIKSYDTKELPVYDVTNFGAIANDEQDDTKAIQATIDHAMVKGGGIVFIPSGTYHVNSDTTTTDILRINGDNIVLRGEGASSEGSVLVSGSQTTQASDYSPWLSPFVVHTGLAFHGTDKFYSANEEIVFARLTAPAKKGDFTLMVDDSRGVKPGEILTLVMQNTSDDGNLIKELMKPLAFDHFQTSYLDAGKTRDASFQYPVEVTEVVDEHTIRFCQPMRREIAMEFKPYVVKTKMLKNIGVENLRFESTWSGEYRHHGNMEMDYGWGAICLHRVSHGWIKNIEIDNYTQTTHLVNSRNVTISNVTITGTEGHYGPKMYSSCDNLVNNVHIKAKRTHGPGLEGCSFGNVYKDIVMDYPAPVDLHGLQNKGFCPPMYNLYENITNISKVGGGGAPENTPHAGEYNTLWNLEIEGWKDGVSNEVFYSWIWRNSKRFNNKMHDDCHKQYLRTILVNTLPKKRALSVEHYRADRDNKWIYIENLNARRKTISLYDYQMKARKKAVSSL